MPSIPSSPVDGNVRVAFVPALADPAAPTVAELTAVGAFDVSCYLTGDGWADGGDQATIADDRLCDRESYTRPGRKSNTLTIRYVHNPDDLTNDRARVQLPEGTRGYFVRRNGPAYEQALAAGDLVEVWPVQLGVQRVMAAEANSVFRVEQPTFITGPVERFVELA